MLGLGDTKASILLTSQMQADLRLVPAESRGAALQYFTGSKAHNIALRQRALSRGYTLNEYALADAATGARIAGETEDGIYAALGLPCIDPTLREARGEIDAAEAGTLPRLVTLDDLRGDVHMHTTASDGRHDIETMAIAARDAGRSYICITDHSQSLAMANGLDDARALAHAARIREANARVDGITILAGIEVDILADGRLDLEESTLAALDFVVASVHSAFDQTAEAMTVRVLTAMACPFVDAIGHPTGRKILRREPHRIDIEALIEAAGLYGIALEINSNYHRLDLSDVHARRAKAQGVGLLIDSDAHSTTELGLLRWGVLTARRAWLEPADVWNTRDVDAFRNGLRRHRRPAAREDGTGAVTVDETLARLKALYFETTQATIEDAFDEAIDLLKTLPSDDERQRAAVYMEGLAEMRQEWRERQTEATEGAAARSAPKPRRRVTRRRRRTISAGPAAAASSSWR